jgi:hypothetical protein
MAKKSKQAEPQLVSADQLKAIAKAIENTSNNIYRVAERIAGRKVGEEIFDQLRKEAGLFRCENCNIWQPVANESATEWCDECVCEDDAAYDEE